MRPLNLIEKLILHASIGEVNDVKVGSVVLLKVDWVLASELSFAGIDKGYSKLGRPQLPRPERFWLAADHIVDPRIYNVPKVKRFIDVAERMAKEHPIDYQPPNETIMHTEFVRGRAQPGQFVVGADSHSCSAGAVGAFAMGLGTTDTLLALISGRTFLEIPEVLSIKLVGKPLLGIGGKDVILYILGQLKRNTVAAERAVEFSGPGLASLSVDARFALCNMSTEFGGLTGVAVPDDLTLEYVQRRDGSNHKNDAHFFAPDEGCVYADQFVIDLSQVTSLIALYPSPDNTTTAKEIEEGKGLELDGCFIGACTTAHEDLVLGALVLEAAMSAGMKPIPRGHRKVTPGSRKIIKLLEDAGLLDIYRKAGFEVGVPGCSYCVGLGADKAAEGEVWLSSQNRNFKNRMGTGSIGNLASAATVALSSLQMRVCDPGTILNKVDRQRFARLCGSESLSLSIEPTFGVPHPNPKSSAAQSSTDLAALPPPATIRGKVQRFGDDVDTDAISPGDMLMAASEAETDEEVGVCCFFHERPGYRKLAREGYNILVAGKGFGCGSSRETAATAIKGCGTKAIIARGYAFIFRRNTANNALPALTITDHSFYEAVDAGGPEVEVSIDFESTLVSVSGVEKQWTFEMGEVDAGLLKKGGAMEAYKKYGVAMYD